MYETEHNRPIFMACYSVMLYLMFVHEMNKEVEWSSHKSVWKSQVQGSCFQLLIENLWGVERNEFQMSRVTQKGKLTDVECNYPWRISATFLRLWMTESFLGNIYGCVLRHMIEMICTELQVVMQTD